MATPPSRPKGRSLKSLRMIWGFATRYPGRIGIAAVALVLAAAATSGIPYAFKLIIDKGFASGPGTGAELARWFPAHADYLDAALSHWLFKHRHGGKPVILRRRLAQPSLALKIPASVDATSADGRVTYQPDV